MRSFVLRELLAELRADPEARAQIARELAPEIAKAFLVASQSQGCVYSTRAGQAPAGYSREGWRAIAHKIGRKRGRYYYVTQEQLDAHERALDGKADPAPANDAPAKAWHPSMAAASLGLRPTGGSR